MSHLLKDMDELLALSTPPQSLVEGFQNGRYRGGTLYAEARCAAQRGRDSAYRRGSPKITTAEFEKTVAVYAWRILKSFYLNEPYEVDHIIPCCVGGQHVAENLQVITAVEHRGLLN